jgi:DNA-binding NtrC family response regulator
MTSNNRPTIILLVEDEALVRMLAWDILTEEAGYRVIEAANADEALALLEIRHDVRLVFTDVDMPGSLNGFGLARIVDMRWPGIKVIVTSGKAWPDPGDLPKEMRFLAKPYAPSVMSSKLAEAAASPASLASGENACRGFPCCQGLEAVKVGSKGRPVGAGWDEGIAHGREDRGELL